MRFAVVLGMLTGTGTLVGCGPSEEEIDQRIAQAVEEAVAASEARTQASFDSEWTGAG